MSMKPMVAITGAGGGIGSILALRYIESGWSVVMTDKNEETGASAAARIAAQYPEADVRFVCADLQHQDEIEALLQLVRQSSSPLHAWINNAGFGITKSPYELTIEEWDRVLNVNLRAAFLCARGAAKLMKESGGGAIVNIASTRAAMSEPHSEAYAASKGGIVSLTHALAASFSPDGVTVNCISPGWIETGDYESLKSSDHEQHWSRRVGKPDDIARACLFLTDPQNRFVNGTNLVIDGGMTKKMIYTP